jgi:hypothetical protein
MYIYELISFGVSRDLVTRPCPRPSFLVCSIAFIPPFSNHYNCIYKDFGFSHSNQGETAVSVSEKTFL